MASGWYRESYRHYLASRGISTVSRYQKKFPRFVKSYPGENPRITVNYARFRQRDPKDFDKKSFRTVDIGHGTKLIVGRLRRRKKKKEVTAQSFLVKRKGYWVRKNLPPRSLMDKLTPEQQEEAKKLLAIGELETDSEIANYFNVDWTDTRGQSRGGEYGRRMTDYEKLDILRKIGYAKGRLPTTADLEEYGITPSHYQSMGGLAVAVNEVIDQESEKAITEGRDVTQIADEWWFGKKIPRIRRPFEERFGKLVPEEIRELKQKRQDAALKALLEADKRIAEQKAAMQKHEELRDELKGLGKKADELDAAFFIPDTVVKVDPVIREKIAEEAAKTKDEMKRKKAELNNVKKGFMSKKGIWETGSDESASEYAQRNLKSSIVEDRFKLWKNGVKKTLLNPKQDLDEEWQEYTELRNGYPEPLAPTGSMERYMQRGAALFGRVVTQANVEPLLDNKMDRSFRDTSMDVLFGRKEN